MSLTEHSHKKSTECGHDDVITFCYRLCCVVVGVISPTSEGDGWPCPVLMVTWYPGVVLYRCTLLYYYYNDYCTVYAELLFVSNSNKTQSSNTKTIVCRPIRPPTTLLWGAERSKSPTLELFVCWSTDILTTFRILMFYSVLWSRMYMYVSSTLLYYYCNDYCTVHVELYSSFRILI